MSIYANKKNDITILSFNEVVKMWQVKKGEDIGSLLIIFTMWVRSMFL